MKTQKCTDEAQHNAQTRDATRTCEAREKNEKNLKCAKYKRHKGAVNIKRRKEEQKTKNKADLHPAVDAAHYSFFSMNSN